MICINIFAFEPNLHISQMTLLACKTEKTMSLTYTTKLHMQKYYANILKTSFTNVKCWTTSIIYTTSLHMQKYYANILENKFHQCYSTTPMGGMNWNIKLPSCFDMNNTRGLVINIRFLSQVCSS